MPNESEIKELEYYCNWIWVEYEYEDQGLYWSATAVRENQCASVSLSFSDFGVRVEDAPCDYGQHIRPVTK